MVHRADAAGSSPRVIEIATLQDSRVADYRSVADPNALLRAGLFVVEGRRTLRRLIDRPRFRLRSVLVTPSAMAALQDVVARLEVETDVYVVDRLVMNEIAGFQIHRGCLALAERPPRSTLDDVVATTAHRLLVLEGVNNPDNVGGIFRSASAFAIDAVLLGPECGDPLYRKAIRTSMAATLQVPFACAESWPGDLHALRRGGFQVLALTPANEARSLDDVPRNLGRVALLVGSEGHGLSAEALAAADERISIRMPGSADSLNVTVAASIALHHFSRPAC